jgi:very-short-patch-repair endonuclease
MTPQHERLLSLLEYAQHSARLAARPAATIAEHKGFALFEDKAQGKPALHFNEFDEPSGREIWLRVERLQEGAPPPCTIELLKPWLVLARNPQDVPALRKLAEQAQVVEAERRSGLPPVQGSTATSGSTASLSFSEYPRREAVSAALQTYLATLWKPWSDEEKRRREVIKLYTELFTLRQQLEGGIVETPFELVWGIGIGVWNCNGAVVRYPLVTQLVEISLNEATADIEITPRQLAPRLEVDWYASVDNPGLQSLEKTAKEFFANCANSFSPYDAATFEALLRSAVTHLDPNGEYWPDRTWAGNRALPEPESKLRISDTWVLFARPRLTSLFIRDLDNFKSKLSADPNNITLPRAVSQVVTEPSTTNPEVILPSFRGISGISIGQGRGDGVADLYFPKPFNGEQVRILQLLERSDGVVVQGPPGTGKTHTIANIICHYLANGKRVLVTSMKEPALGVLRDALPTDIQSLAISLLSSEHAGMKQFEHAIQRIASEIQSLDRPSTRKEISRLDQNIDSLHSQLAATDSDIQRWAHLNLNPISIDGTEISPLEAATEVIQSENSYEWLTDDLDISEKNRPQFSHDDVVKLRDARRVLGSDIQYLGTSLPEICDLPTPESILQAHEELCRLATIDHNVHTGALPPVTEQGDQLHNSAANLLAEIEEVRRLSTLIRGASGDWTLTFKQHLQQQILRPERLALLDNFGQEVAKLNEARNAFIIRPVHVPTPPPFPLEAVTAITNLSEGKSPFAVFGFFTKAEHKDFITGVRLLDRHPMTEEEWSHVLRFLRAQELGREMVVRWNALATELRLQPVNGKHADPALAVVESYEACETVRALITAESRLKQRAKELAPTSSLATCKDGISDSVITEFESMLRQHLERYRLREVQTFKQRILRRLDGRSGIISDRIRHFTAAIVGSTDVSASELQQSWTDIVRELSRVGRLRSHLDIVADVTSLIQTSGAPLWADALRNTGAQDDVLLANDWAVAWRYRRLCNHLCAIDKQQELRRLSAERTKLETQLSTAYKDVIVKRTWLRLAENASPSIRTALQAYLNAIQKIGKGTGKRAVRYREDARHAAALANPAVPCWIMPHYRVSESLPSDLGCFDLVIIDEASQSDLTALPALLRAQQVLIVGDDKQVSPDAVGLEEEKVRSLMQRFLTTQVPTVRAQLSPERSIYDLLKVVFAASTVMLKEHFRCVAPIIEYSKREFYDHQLRPLRRARPSERLDPPLIDVMVEDGYRQGDINRPEVRFIVDEIKAIAENQVLANRSIGVVSLLGDKQAFEVWQTLTEELGTELMERHRIACGDARTFQGKERSIMFLSMVCAPNEGKIAPLVRDTFAQRFNVAASRAQDRMYLVRSVELEHLSNADRLRRGLISHFSSPFMRDEIKTADARMLCESPFECDVFDKLVERGYFVTPQVKVGQYRIDMVVEGSNDARLAIECDGDRYHGQEHWADDMLRQRILERAGWTFWRCFASAWIRRKDEMLKDLLSHLYQLGIEPWQPGSSTLSAYTQQRRVRAVQQDAAAATTD